MSISKEALEYLVNEGENKDPIIELQQGTFSKVNLNRVYEPTADFLEVSTLTGLIDYLKSNIDQIEGRLLIHIDSYNDVMVYGPLNEDRRRERYIRAAAVLPKNIKYGYFDDVETFNIMLQSSFVDNEDRKVILKYTGLIKDENVQTTGDDGISQKVTIKTGVASVADAIVPNPVTLAPYRTFQEIAQPESKFIFRMKTGPYAALFEADGGAWRNEAELSIKEYLKENLKEMKNIAIIA